MSLFEWCTKKCFSRAKEHPAFLRTRTLVNTTSHLVSGIVHHEVLPTCLFHVRQEQRVSSSASLVKRSEDPCSRVSGPHAPSVVAAQQKLHRSSPAVRVAAGRVAQDGQVVILRCRTRSFSHRSLSVSLEVLVPYRAGRGGAVDDRPGAGYSQPFGPSTHTVASHP